MRKPARWLLPAQDPSDLSSFAQELCIGLPAARVLWNRGYTALDAAQRFLRPSVEHLLDPAGLRDMGCAVERTAAAISAREKILLYGDYDVDGTVSLVILKKTLDMLGASSDFHVPHRMRDGYGMNAARIDQAVADGVRLIISVDTGIRAGAVVQYAREHGIDVVVTDHHLPEAELPPAIAVINPNRPDCGYSEKNLCGAGVTLKLVQALLLRSGWPADRVGRMLVSLLKLVALATVADVVPLTGENRVIVKLGLDGYDDVRNPGLRALLDVAGIQPGARPSAGQVGFQLAPRINAAGRMDDAGDVVRMFLTDDAGEARRIAERLNDLNRERQDTEKSIKQACESVVVTDAEAGLVFSGPEWHKGVVGIVASRMVDLHYRPVFVLCEDAETELAQGSGRSVPGVHLLEALEFMPDLFTKFGGHKQAAGVTLPLARVAEFRERFNAYAAARLRPEDFCPAYEFDGAVALTELNDRSADDVLALAPFGYGNPEPLFVVAGAEVCGPCKRLGEKGLLVPVRQNGRMLMAKCWSPEREPEFAPGSRVDIGLAVQADEYSRQRGYSPWCVVLKDARPAAATAGV